MANGDFSVESFSLFPNMIANVYGSQLEKEIEYIHPRQFILLLSEKRFDVPRRMAVYGDSRKSLEFFGVTLHARPWTPSLLKLKSLVEKKCNEKFNLVIVDQFRKERDELGPTRYHESVHGSVIVIVSFGTTPIHLELKIYYRDCKTFPLRNGTMFIIRDLGKWLVKIPNDPTRNKPQTLFTFMKIH